MLTAVLTVVLAHRLRRHPTPAGQAGGFGTTFLWVPAITIAAAVPTVVLARAERRALRSADAAEPRPAAGEPVENSR
ncbi:hypothetical protein AB0I49_18340 [Streptomyces sp. NPDC050617]|uniref:hypothetical protein n=1 Tax=Streptomyces sp. NPDC050617 TaxID=3154628 RepID=UPI0034240EFA